MKPLIVVALGGNALLERDDELTFRNLQKNASRVAAQVASLVPKFRIVLTHGNGPQVGLLASLKGNEDWPLHNLGAESQGMIGSVLEMELRKSGVKHVACMLTHVVVSESDPAMQKPSKPIGPFFATKPTEFPSAFDEAKKQWRKVVASPDPKDVVELPAIEALFQNHTEIVICGGGGGIPVTMDEKGNMKGVEAVIDKDLTSSLIASRLKAHAFIIHTDVAGVYEDFPKKTKMLTQVPLTGDVQEEGQWAQRYPGGTMRPKVVACVRFIRNSTDHSQYSVIGNDLVDITQRGGGTRFQKQASKL